MPTIFISYKRGTSAIGPLRKALHAAKYRTWFDRDNIHLGDRDWRARIDLGLERCDAVVLGVTPEACESEPVRYEVSKARALNKPIFPLILEQIDDYFDAIRKLGLPERQHIEDFTDATCWNDNIDRLLRDLCAIGLTATRHELRKWRGEKEHTLHQRYLKRVVERVGMLQLSHLAVDQPGSIPLERVYVESPTFMSLGMRIREWQIVEWWINLIKSSDQLYSNEHASHNRFKPIDLDLETASLESLLEHINERITVYRERHPNETVDYQFNTYKNDSEHDSELPLSIQDIAAARDRLMVLGAPGSGKSTFVRHLALCLAGAQIEDWNRPDATLNALGQWPHGALTPVYVELRDFLTSEYFPTDINVQPSTTHLWRYIESELLGNDLSVYSSDLQVDLEEGHAVLILDGLDEVPYPEGALGARQHQLQNLAHAINETYGPSRVIITSRPYAYEGWKLPGFQAVMLANFEDEHRIALAVNLYCETGFSEKEARAKAERLNTQLGPIDPQLKDRPLFMTLMAIIFMRGDEEGLPIRKGALYRQSILLLLDRWTRSKPGAKSLSELLGKTTTDEIYQRLAGLAYEVHDTHSNEQLPKIDVGLLFKHMMPLGYRTAAELIPYLSKNAGVLVSPGQDDQQDVFYFAHRSFQEYLAAVELVRRCEDVESFSQIGMLIISKPFVWREPCKLTGDVLVDTNRGRDLWNLLDDLLVEVPGDGLMADDSRWWRIWLAGQIAAEQELHKQVQLRRGEAVMRTELIESLTVLLQTSDALLPSERVECGRALGRLGDPRPGVGLHASGIPDIDWVEIPAGDFFMGSTEKHIAQIQEHYDYWDWPQNELPQHTVTLAHFAVSRYPITYLQYTSFVEDGGYTNDDYWTSAGLEWRGEKCEPEVYWKDSRWHISNHPVVGVTWYETYAFAQWLSVKLSIKVRLPTEAEWERVARGTEGNIYPYGNIFSVSKNNTSETGIGRTNAVGVFVSGSSPEGVLDMSGNVYEWCLTKWRNSFAEPEDNSPNGLEKRVVRGGSWDFDQDVARTAYRFRNLPFGSSDGLGFRVVCVL